MPPEETAAAYKSPLDKPLHLLTDDDISQLTREDCRRYLKEKGMRRPSWNKSQAIQQVISLKTLLETPPSDFDSAAVGSRNKHYNPRPNTATTVHRHVPKVASADMELSEPADDTVPCHNRDLNDPEFSGDLSGCLPPANNDSAPRTTCSANASSGQMTIFYCGKVNVYDDVPAEKAQAIMHLAASPLNLPQEPPFYGNGSSQPSPHHLQTLSGKVVQDSSVPHLRTPHPVKMNDNSWLLGEESNACREDNPGENPASRKASVQRYLEKRKDRFKSKRKIGMTSSASLDVYVNRQMVNQISDEQLSRSDACSSPKVKAPATPTRCGSVDNNVVKDANLSTCFEEKDIKGESAKTN